MRRVAVQRQRNVAHDIFDEFRIVVRALGHIFFIGPLQQTPDFARRSVFRNADLVLDRNFLPGRKLGGDRDVRALIVRTVVRDLLAAWAQAGNRNDDLLLKAGRFAIGADVKVSW